MMTGTPESVTFVPISRIEVLNSRDRNMKVFEEIVDNIRCIGLKKPITVTERPGQDGQISYHLVCGEGRLNAFRILGETHIPARVRQAHVDERGSGRPDAPLTTAERQELAQLRRQLRQVTQERDILAKATAWFANKDSAIDKTSMR